MKDYLIAERYAMGLSAAIENDDGLDPARLALKDLADMYEGHHDLRSVLGNPVVLSGTRAGILAKIMDRLEPPKPVRRLAEVLLERGRIVILPNVAVVFATLVDQRLNRTGATVTTAVPLSEAHQERLRKSLEGYTGKKLRAEFTVDPDVVGGVTARVGGLLIDGSVRSRLKRLKLTLLAEEM